ncbi:MAG: DUF4280 domain-containing protein [Lachnospiraceae bacterium]|nr:DUF4280 domain-containing protein [Lachnospiraceae bacterium]
MGDKGKYIDEIGRQQGEWDELGTDGQQEIKDSREQIEAGEADSSEAIREYIIQHNENKKNPAYLVRGAELICSQGTNKRMMNLSKCHGVYIKAHAAVHELDCVHTNEENITWFGVCDPGEGLETEDIELVADNGEKCHGKKCEPHIIGTWQESFERTRIVDNGDKKKESGEDLEGCNTITMDSFLVCKHGGIIMPLSSGQDREVEESEFVEGKDAYDRVMNFTCEEGAEELLYAKLSENEEEDVYDEEEDVHEGEVEIIGICESTRELIIELEGDPFVTPRINSDGTYTAGYGYDFTEEDDPETFNKYFTRNDKDEVVVKRDLTEEEVLGTIDLATDKKGIKQGLENFISGVGDGNENKELNLNQNQYDALFSYFYSNGRYVFTDLKYEEWAGYGGEYKERANARRELRDYIIEYNGNYDADEIIKRFVASKGPNINYEYVDRRTREGELFAE